MRWFATKCGIFLLLTSTLGLAQEGSTIVGSLHDLSVRGKGTVKSGTEQQVCVFCHALHITDSKAPGKALWNQQLSYVGSYGQYTSSTYKQPNRTLSVRSKLCLSCHDGTVAIGQTYSASSRAQQGVAFKSIPFVASMPAASQLGIDLSRDHPFGFAMPVVDDGEVRLSLAASPPTTSDPAVNLADNKIECVTCHEPHTPNRDSATPFMARSNSSGALCTACHDTSRGILAGWPSSSHAVSSSAVTASSNLPYSTVAANACASCHSMHNGKAASGTRLLRGQDEVVVCMKCHGDNPAIIPSVPSLAPEFRKTYSHPVGMEASPPHDAAESLPVNNSRHVECVDCHNPHASSSDATAAVAPAIQRSQNGVSGISSSGSVLAGAANQYEVCFKCHADSKNKPQSTKYNLYGREPLRASMASDPFNLRLDFSSQVARHNVTQAARPGVSQSLRGNMLDLNGNPSGRLLSTSPYLYCTDCHNNDSAQLSNSSPPGPHGSRWIHLLERQYQENSVPLLGAGGLITPIPYASGVNGPYALCDKCHDLDNRLGLSGAGSDLAFGKHHSHVVNDGISCSVCHASHGVQEGSNTNNKHLVDFDIQIVRAYGANALPYVDTARRQCFLSCHGVAHNGSSY
jgi:predicted CXXCH cytochrome family protein